MKKLVNFRRVSVVSVAIALLMGGRAIAQSESDLGFPRIGTPRNTCPPSVLSQMRRHTIAPGETLDSIAEQYDLIPATLLGMNPILRGDRLPVGRDILVPPLNGIRITVPAETTWQDLAEEYNVRADTLFEVNGCQPPSNTAFVPGVNWSPLSEEVETPIAEKRASAFAVYPLPNPVEAIVGYGWVLTPRSSSVVFHSGLDLPAAVGTPVRTVEGGTVAFAGTRNPYGNFVVINHRQGRQTRYAHLERINVRQGQTVEAGDRIGTVGITGTPDSPQPHLHFEVRSNSDLGWVAENPLAYYETR
ncbi:Membrane protein related to metalloendopeptidase [Geitlerinema sp. FC II]|nr:Membrane protein related to metalloendopeptidase [Geitlerinema sp. FC II]